MADDVWITIPNWPKFQHYGNRRPAWIKLYLELRDKDEWRQLTLAEQGLLVNIWIHYEPARGQLSLHSLRSKIPQKFRTNQIDSLVYAGFIVLAASKPLAHFDKPASAEKEKEKELRALTSVVDAQGPGFQIPDNLLKEIP